MQAKARVELEDINKQYEGIKRIAETMLMAWNTLTEQQNQPDIAT